ncbi:MAG: hypothetical protein IPI07_18120, partial [Flavobacteriales bacterium]|nr:hypothetical protein [Flavobacteriales bacterium]
HSPEMSTEDKQAVHFFMVVNENMEPLWQHFITSEVKGTRSTLLDVEVTNDGTATAWVKNKFGSRDVKKGVVDFESRIHRMNAEGQTENIFKMEGADYPVDVDLLSLADGSMVCAGVYGSLDEKKDKTLVRSSPFGKPRATVSSSVAGSSSPRLARTRTRSTRKWSWRTCSGEVMGASTW